MNAPLWYAAGFAEALTAERERIACREDAATEATGTPRASASATSASGLSLRPQPARTRIHAELRRPGVTLLLLWEEYRAGQPEGYGYSRFCDLYAEWRGSVSLTSARMAS